jgi:two-component sensor histidine kinase
MIELMNFYNTKMGGEGYLIKLDFLEPLARSYRLLNDKIYEFWARKEIADIHYQQGKSNLAIEALFQIAKEQKAGGYSRICYTYDLLSGIYFANSNYGKALYYALETLKHVRTAEDSLYLAHFYKRIAVSYSSTGSIAEALDWNLKRLNYLITRKQTYNTYGIIYDMTSDLIKLGRPGEALSIILDKSKTIVPSANVEKRSRLFALAKCYEALNNNNRAEKYCEELIKLRELRIKQKEIRRDDLLDRYLATFYLSIAQYNKAEKYFKRAILEWPEKVTGLDASYKSNFLFKLDSAKGNYLSAIKHLQEQQMIHDSLFSSAKSKQIEELKITFETEQKDNLLKSNEQNIHLLTNQSELQKSKLKQATLLRNITFGAVSLLVIIVILLFSRYRLKQRTNKTLELQQKEIEEQNFSLRHLVTEKEWLLKEIHHRVKNNLQTVMALLGTQAGYLKNEEAITAMTDSQHRIQSMSLIHQRLYQSGNLSSLTMTDYIHELVDFLGESYNNNNCVRFSLEIEPIKLDLAHCIPLGLILNEAITNSFKYAFPGGREGIIRIVLKRSAENNFLLTVQDNGTGLPAGFDISKSHSMGMNLMRGLSAEIGAKFIIYKEHGTCVAISFVYEQHALHEITSIITETASMT